jgi:hypothetical protein
LNDWVEKLYPELDIASLVKEKPKAENPSKV